MEVIVPVYTMKWSLASGYQRCVFGVWGEVHPLVTTWNLSCRPGATLSVSKSRKPQPPSPPHPPPSKRSSQVGRRGVGTRRCAPNDRSRRCPFKDRGNPPATEPKAARLMPRPMSCTLCGDFRRRRWRSPAHRRGRTLCSRRVAPMFGVVGNEDVASKNAVSAEDAWIFP